MLSFAIVHRALASFVLEAAHSVLESCVGIVFICSIASLRIANWPRKWHRSHPGDNSIRMMGVFVIY